jgi:hypothetical protein
MFDIRTARTDPAVFLSIHASLRSKHATADVDSEGSTPRMKI